MITLADTQKSSNINKELIEYELGLKRLLNTTVFLKGDIFVLSPSVQNDHSWFDLRKINIDRYREKGYKGYLLIRYFNKFLLTELDTFVARMIPENKFVETKGIGIHWKFNVLANGKGYSIINRQNNAIAYDIAEATIEEIKEEIDCRSGL